MSEAHESTTSSNQIQTGGGHAPERTRSGPVYSPAVDIFESDDAITVLADMPGVKAEDLKVDLRDNVLTLSGRVSAPEGSAETGILIEYQPGTFLRQFTLGETIEQSKIDAKLSDGVLRLELPKLERLKPRQISVRTS
jgi:HSP20 family protein